MSGPVTLEPLDLAALLCSRVCHDLISPTGAIVNGLEVLEEDGDAETKAFARSISLAFTATMTVLRDIRAAPTAGDRTIPTLNERRQHQDRRRERQRDPEPRLKSPIMPP